jgi:hypothetical protein
LAFTSIGVWNVNKFCSILFSSISEYSCGMIPGSLFKSKAASYDFVYKFIPSEAMSSGNGIHQSNAQKVLSYTAMTLFEAKVIIVLT